MIASYDIGGFGGGWGVGGEGLQLAPPLKDRQISEYKKNAVGGHAFHYFFYERPPSLKSWILPLYEEFPHQLWQLLIKDLRRSAISLSTLFDNPVMWIFYTSPCQKYFYIVFFAVRHFPFNIKRNPY